MKRMLDLTDTDAVVKTTNGATTYTSLVYARELREFTPLPNGFNRELADYIVDYIEEREGRLWDQNHWRNPVVLSDGDTGFEELVAAAPHLVFSNAWGQNACGTSMCFAGWASELTGADQIVDAKALAAYATGGKLGDADHRYVRDMVAYYGDNVLVRNDDPTFQEYLEYRFHGEYPQAKFPSSPTHRDYLASRGFTPETHSMIELSTYAAICLGIAGKNWRSDGYSVDPRGLFRGQNTWVDVKAIIDAYTEYGMSDRDLSGDGAMRLQIMLMGAERGGSSWRILEDGNAKVDKIAAELFEAKMGYDYHLSVAPSWAKLVAEDEDEFEDADA